MSTVTTCESIEELIPAYEIGALSAADHELVAYHLAQCDRCQAIAAEYAPVAEGLLFSAPLRRAPAHLEADFMRRLPPKAPASPQPVAAETPSTGLRAWLWPRLSFTRLATAVAVALLVLLNVLQYAQLQRLQPQASEAAAMEQLMTSRHLEVLALKPGDVAPNGKGQIYLDRTQNLAYLVVTNLPSLPPDKAYQMWLVSDNARISAAIFRVNPDTGAATVIVHAPQPIGSYTRTGITIEPAGGSPGPTTSRVIGTDF